MIRASICFLALALPALAQSVPAAKGALATADKAPFTFTYGGKEAAALLPGWTKSEADAKSQLGFPVHQIIYRDPATKLKVTVEIRSFTDFPAVDWVLWFTNEGTQDTPVLENILPLRTTFGCDSPEAHMLSTCGSAQSREDFALTDLALAAGQDYAWGPTTGRSSDALSATGGHGAFPFYQVQTGDHGTFVAIGWTGDWLAHVARAADGKSLALQAGMVKTHLVLHPGETIRTPRILLMDAQGNFDDTHNTWRKLLLAHYSPVDPQGKVVQVPASWDTWGTEKEAVKVGTAKKLGELGIAADDYWMDAGWYPPIGDPGANGNWSSHRGNWTPSKSLFPNGLKPVGEALKSVGIGFLVWFEAETASGDAPWVTQHPDWYLTAPGKEHNDDWPYYLNLGNPEAYHALVTEISQFITDNELTWYRQDFNFQPAPYWAGADQPDRIGMSEIKSIMGLYDYWDALRAQHPGLQIDNCSSGGRRIDLETISRAVELWRSDNAGEPMGEMWHTEGLLPWVPLTAGVWIINDKAAMDSSTQIYRQRCGYCAGFTACVGPDPKPEMKAVFDEFREVRPYFYGDYYPLLPQRDDLQQWSAWQLDRPDKGDGLIVCLRRQESIYCTLQLDLKKIDPAATYEVEVRTSQQHAPVKEISGTDFARFAATISDMPGSVLIFYRKK